MMATATPRTITRRVPRAPIVLDDQGFYWYCQGCHHMAPLDLFLHCSECAWMGVRRARPEPWGRVITHGLCVAVGMLLTCGALFSFVPNVRIP